MAKNVLYRRLLLLRTVFHSVFLLSNAAILLHTVVVMVRKTSEPGVSEHLLDMRDNAPAFLTNWNMAFQMTFLMIAVYADCLEWIDRGWRLRKLEQARDVIFCALVLPYGVFVTIHFWVAYSINRELVFPRIFDDALPWMFNHCVHTTIAVVMVLEILQHPRTYPTNRKYEEALYWTVTFVYSAMIQILHLATGHWLYKIFDLMNWWKLILFHIYIFLFPYIFYHLQFPLNRLIHGSADYQHCVDYSPASKEMCIEEEDLQK
ncbi:androgen-dependent TFPI-regulating protein-like [Aricia agestis]|uniref:androgen-dependent TFPI-regulating protein-like n=1 Tax=Aricia agestis TaxID=91739 RepID=UPI001C20298B|nr:androgen-dependent TFPI-regulating protein-like [Aricia agestis]